MTVNSLRFVSFAVVAVFLSATFAVAQPPIEIRGGFGIGRKPGPPRPVAAPGAPAAVKAETEKTEETPEPEAPVEVGPINPRQIKLHLLDGSTISGELTVDEITVGTDFGPLTVPVAKLRSFKPGLSSYPELFAKVNELIESLGSDDFKTREQAHKDLAKWGVKVRGELERCAQDDHAERKRHIMEIIKDLDEQAQDASDDEGTPEQPWVRGDTVVTADFTIVGKIEMESFKVNSKYGPLNVQLADIGQAERAIGRKTGYRKSVSVEGNNLVQRAFKAAGIRVERGDKITIKAEGTINMSPWGSNQNSTPDGGANFGLYQQIPGGALLAKVGNNGKLFKVGSKHTFVATQSGPLHFAIAMQDQYSQEGYAFPGQYNVKITVEPK